MRYVQFIFVLGLQLGRIHCERNLLGLYETPYDVSSYLSTDAVFQSKYSLQFPLNAINPPIPASTIEVPICNHYAVNRGSIVYSPCSAQYLVAAANYGAILLPNMCTGMSGTVPCPTTGFNNSDTETCALLPGLSSSTTNLFDQYCQGDAARLSTKRCLPVPNPNPGGPMYSLSPPIFTATTNWCDPMQNVQPVYSPYNRIMLTTGGGDYPFSFETLTETQTLAKHTCPGDNGYGSSPVPF